MNARHLPEPHTGTAALQARIQAAWQAAWGTEGPGPSHWVQAPGRVNLIGEHTDYNDGFVLPCAINFQTVIAARPRADRSVRVVAADYGNQADQFSLDAPIAPHPTQGWANYVRGMVWVLQAAGLPLCGADLVMAGNVPQGAGLSSSASLEVAVGQAFKALLGGTQPEPKRLAQLAQRAENEFVGCRCGIMDQLISACGHAGHALLIDCRSLVTQPVAMPADMAVLIVESRVQRGLVDSEYNLRRQQCEAVARQLGVPALRDATLAMLQAHQASLDAVALRRARHVITENARTQAAASALQAGDAATLGQLMAQSHASMRDDFEITVPAIDHLVAILQQVIGTQGGARMTGGGFGGCVVALLPTTLVPAARDAIAARYRAPNGDAAVVHVCSASAGAASWA